MNFSIIIPAYNCECCIGRTLDCIVTQNYDDYEIIVVDDGSTDSTPRLLEKYAQENDKIKVYSIPNSGPAHARNIALGKAQGSYILFIDSDDLFLKGALAYLAAEIDTHPADVYQFGHIITDEHLQPVKKYFFKPAYAPAKMILKEDFARLYEANLLHQIWNKVYRSAFLKQCAIEMEDYKYGEDRLFVFEVLRFCGQLYITDKCLYYYVSNPLGSLISNYYDKKFDCCCLIDCRVRALAQQVDCVSEEATRIWDYMFIKSVISCMVPLFHPSCGLTRAQKRTEIKKMLHDPQVHRKMNLDRSAGMSTILLQKIIYSRIVWLNMLAVRTIHRVIQKNPNLFIAIKHRGHAPA